MVLAVDDMRRAESKREMLKQEAAALRDRRNAATAAWLAVKGGCCGSAACFSPCACMTLPAFP
jgi:hypothetical protein